MVGVFNEVLNLSITCSYIIVALLICRAFLRKAPKIFSYGLWFILLIKIIVPINIESPLGLIEKGKGTFIGAAGTRDIIGEIIKVESYAVNKEINYMNILSVIWITVSIGMILFAVFSMIKIKRKLKDAELLNKRIYKSKKIKTAFVFGIINPKIYLPKGLSKEEEKYVLAHEKVHIKRLDYLVKLVWYIVLSINWFNPLFWIAFKLMSKDMEMSCDEKVISEMGSDIKKDYSISLLNLASKGYTISITPIGFGNGEAKERIKNILKYKKPKVIVTVVSAVIVVLIGITFLTYKIEAKEESSTIIREEVKNDKLEKKYKNPTKLGDYKHKSENEIENLVYETALKRVQKYYEGEFTVLAVQINGEYREEDKLKVFAEVFDIGYVLENKKVIDGHGSKVPVAITYKINEDGTYTIEKYEEPISGDSFTESIKSYCKMPVSGKKIKGLDKKIVENCMNGKINELQRKHLIEHLKENNQFGVSIGEYNDNLELEYNKIT